MKHLYCNPFFGERKCAYRFSNRLHYAFENSGRSFERFDYYGTGEAEGEFKDITFESLTNDILKYLRKDSYCLIGTRLGASLAFECMIRNPLRVKMLIMINPVIYGSKYIEYVYRSQRIKSVLTGNDEGLLEEDGYVNIEGYKTSKKMIEQIRGYLLLDECNLDCASIPIYLINISKNEISETERSYELLKKRHPNVNIIQLDIPVFWRRIPTADYSELINPILECCNDTQ